MVQARAAALPQIGGEASISRSRDESSSPRTDPVTGQPTGGELDRESETTSRNLGINGRQMLFDRGVFTRIRSQRALSNASDFQLESSSDSLVTRTSEAYFNVLVSRSIPTSAVIHGLSQ